MTTKLNVNATQVIIGGKASNALKGIGKTLSHEAMISGYGSIANTDIGYIITNTYDAYETLRAFHAPALVNDAYHGAWSFFLDAIAHQAETSGSHLGSYHNVATGQDYNLFYEDLLSGHQMIEADLLTNDPNSIEAHLDYSRVNWNDPTSRSAYLQNLQNYAQTIGLRDHAGFNASLPASSEYELKILFHASNTQEYTAYINQFETAIKEHFDTQLSNAQQHALALGYKGSLYNVKALQKFAAKLGPADRGAIEQLIRMTNGSINQVDQFILARISEGHIDIQKILAGTTGPDGVTRYMFNGVELDEKTLFAFAALNVFAHSDAVATSYQTQILESIGGSSELCEFDLNKLKHVNIRCREFEDALTKAGYGAWQPANGKFQIATKAGKRGVIKGVGLQHMSLKQLQNIDLSSIKDTKIRDALKQYINLREHKDTLNAAQQLMQNMKMRITQLVRKVLGDSDLSQAIGQIQSQYRNVQFALKVWAKIVDIGKWIGKISRTLALKKDARLLKNTHKSKFQKFHELRYKRRMQSNRSGKARQEKYDQKQANRKQKAQTKNQNKAQAKNRKIEKLNKTKRGRKKVTKRVKRTQSNLLRKPGKQGSEAVRRAGHLVKHGTTGTTAATSSSAAATAAGSSAAGGASAGASAAGTAGGASVGVICFWVILIILIVATVCQLISAMFNVILSTATEFDNTLLGKMTNWVTDLLKHWKWPWEASEEQKENVLWYTMLKLQNEDAAHKQVSNVIPSTSCFKGGYAPAAPGTEQEGKTHTYLSQDKHPDEISWVKPQYRADNIGNWPESNTYYLYTNAETGEPLNEYTNIKTCLSMAHAYTYHIETKEHIEHFTTYALGLWNYLNQHVVTATLDMCSGCGTYTYDCNIDWDCRKGCVSPCTHSGADWDSAYYSELCETNEIYKTAPGAKISISLNNPYKFYVVDGVPTDKTNQGCTEVTHHNKSETGEITKRQTLTSLFDSTITYKDSKTTGTYIMLTDYHDTYNEEPRYGYNPNIFGNADGAGLMWQYNPKGISECFNEYPALKTDDMQYITSRSEFTFCGSSGSSWDEFPNCNNYEIKATYSRNESEGHCGSLYRTVHGVYENRQNVYLTSSRDCQSGPHYAKNNQHYNEKRYYQCNGHTTPVYCITNNSPIIFSTQYKRNGTKYHPYNPQYTSHGSTSECSCGNSIKYDVYVFPPEHYTNIKPQLATIYICPGHQEDHGVFEQNSPYDKVCSNRSNPVLLYECDGYCRYTYQQSSNIYVCKGHLKCSTPHECPGHTLTYCQGHISYQIERKSIWVESEAIYKDNWTYTVPGNKFLWFASDPITYSPQKSPSNSSHKSLARGDWAGWNADNRELMAAVYSSDWYSKYGVGLDSFVGGQCSTAEKAKIKEEYKITEEKIGTQLMQNLDFALDACGKVCYYPGDKAVAEGMSPANKFNTIAPDKWDKNNVQRSLHGLDPKYFADWVYRSTHENTTHASLSTEFHKNPYAVRINTLPGTPIVNNADPNNIRTGILITAFEQGGTLKIRYVGMDTGSQTGGGWVTILTESANGWKYSINTQS